MFDSTMSSGRETFYGIGDVSRVWLTVQTPHRRMVLGKITYRWVSRDMCSKEWLSRLTSFCITRIFPEVPWLQASVSPLNFLPASRGRLINKNITRRSASYETHIRSRYSCIRVSHQPISTAIGFSSFFLFFTLGGYIWSEKSTVVIFV